MGINRYRKNPRLRDADYSQNGCYFITICTHNRECLFGNIPVGAIHESPKNNDAETAIELNENGQIVKVVLESVENHYENVLIDTYCIMPNHVHLIVSITDNRAICESPLHSRSLLSKVVGYIKMSATKLIRSLNEGYIEVWQRGYHDHIIRSDAEYNQILGYIEANPSNWQDDEEYA